MPSFIFRSARARKISWPPFSKPVFACPQKTNSRILNAKPWTTAKMTEPERIRYSAAHFMPPQFCGSGRMRNLRRIPGREEFLL
jgi:hypothetical protein